MHGRVARLPDTVMKTQIPKYYPMAMCCKHANGIILLLITIPLLIPIRTNNLRSALLMNPDGSSFLIPAFCLSTWELRPLKDTSLRYVFGLLSACILFLTTYILYIT